eukprot:CAMPEP_0201565582 /NCGR_PEP_ID=MMETSP0190_2-20130828/4799_1 /ASSEMBLY_ACC=CAM_ASM_000263 /TAXON_ID=37353 /ORGANISM="Rosalina sp." /LENGTH=456 /DNA_ID=CAMNT_0047983239 /DNA_START=27 /DNA_END=1397 /DNA_ORIENTATION=+
MLALVLFLSAASAETGISSSQFTIATWNSYDVVYGANLDARRDYVFENKEELFSDIDILCTQESHTYESIKDFVTNFGEIYPYYKYNNDPSTEPYQACSQEEIADFENSTSSIYSCNEACTDSLPSTLGYAFCLWRCFGELRDDTTGITTRDNNPELFDLGQELELSPCLSCLWRSNYVQSLAADWTANNDTSMAMFEDIIDSCTQPNNAFDYKANEGIILWSKYAFDTVEFVKLPEAVFTLRGYIKATIAISGYEDLTVICTHLETPTINGYFGGKFTTMIQENIDNDVTEMSNITQLEIDALINIVNAEDGNVVVLGDLNIGINSRVDLYDGLLSGSGLGNVFGSNMELSAAVNCSRCSDNPYTGNQEIVDHILYKGDITVVTDSAMRFLDDTYNTSAGMIPLSDHYGIKATLMYPEPTKEPTPSPISEIDDSKGNYIGVFIGCMVSVLFCLME